MKFARGIVLWGVVIYALMYLLWSGLVIYGVSGEMYALGARIGLLIAVTVIAGSSIRVATWHDLLPYTIGWALMAILLDGIFLVPSFGTEIYSTWSVWVGYTLIAALPFLSRSRGFHTITPAPRAL